MVLAIRCITIALASIRHKDLEVEVNRRVSN